MSERGRQWAARGLLLCLLCLSISVGAAGAAEPLNLPLDGWRFDKKGNFAGSLDRRGLYQIAHPLEAAKAGDYGRIETEVTIPEGATPPFTLRFYVSDNLYGEGHSKRSVADVRVGHRFKQVLVDGKPVWSQDIAVNMPRQDPQCTLVDITPHVRPGQKFTLGLQLRQKLNSDEQTPEDLIQLGVYAGTTKQYTPLPRDKYGTQTYWGDVAVHTGPPPKAEDLPCRYEPALKRTKIRFPRVDPAMREEADLAVEKRGLLQGAWPWPVTQGIPLPMGALKDVKHVALIGPDSRFLSVGLTPLSRWPDGSLRWVLADFLLPAGAPENVKLTWGSEVTASTAAPADPVRASDDLHSGNGLVWARWTKDDAGAPKELTIGRGESQVVVNGLRPYLNFKDKALQAKWREGRWLSRSPHRAEMEVTGELVAADGDRYGTCRVRVTVFAGSPFIRLVQTIVNEREEPIADDALDHDTVKRTRGLVGGVRAVTGAVTAYGLRLLMPKATARQTGEGWLAAQGQGGWTTGVLRYAKHLWPAGLACGPEGIDFQLFKPGDKRMSVYKTYPGEAKTHEIWLAVTDGAPAKEAAANLAQRVETPPRLDTSVLIRDSHVWGAVAKVGPKDCPAEYALIVERYFDPYYANTREDIRHYGNYSSSINNFYWNRLHSIYLLYAMTGDRKWYDWAERSCRHYMDICTLNWWPDGSKVGAKVRNVDKFFAVYLVHQNPHPMFDHWNMTGDPDGLRLGRANADFVMGDKAMRKHTDGNSARQQGWPLMAMVRALQETGDPRYAAHAKHIVDVALDYMEDRRGAYLQRHGSNSHLGIVPFMTGILCTGLRQYHFWTGDDRAGAAVVQNAEAMFAEMHDPLRTKTAPNLDYYYSPNPYLRSSDGKTPIAHLNPNVVSAQAYAAYLTDDPKLADIAWRGWKAYMQTAGWERNSYDFLYDLHAVLYWLKRAPVPDRTPQITVGRFWRYGAAGPEIWIDRPDTKPFEAKVRWTAYERPYYRGQPIPNWSRYCKRRALRGQVQLLDPTGRPVASAPMDFEATPHGAPVVLRADTGEPGLYRIVTHGAQQAPVGLILKDLSPHVERWGLPIDRGWLCEGSQYCFGVPAGCRELSIRYGLLTPWEKISVALTDSDGTAIKDCPRTARDLWKTSYLTWQIPVPDGAHGKVWCFRQSPPASAILRIAGAGPMVSVSPEAFFVPKPAPPSPDIKASDAPPEWRGEVQCIEPGKKLSIPLGQKTGDGIYEHVHAHRGTIEFWMRADTSDDSMDNITFFRFGRLHLWRRTQTGTYLNLDKGFLQSGFLIRPKAWYHVAVTWDLGDGQRKPTMNLLLNGVPMTSRMQTELPPGTGDWTGESLEFGNAAPMRIAGLRISSVVRDKELEEGILSPAPDKHTLYWEDDGAKP